MQEQEYNGWTNYPTWAVNLWLSNEESLYLETTETVRLVCERVTEPDDFGDVASLRRFEVAEGLKRWVTEDLAPDLGASFAADILGFAFGCVDWYEIADAWLAESVPTEQACRDCGRTFPYSEDADYCPDCIAAMHPGLDGRRES